LRVFCALGLFAVIAVYRSLRILRSHRKEWILRVWISLEPETQSLQSRTRRYSEWTCLSRIMLRAAYSAPSTFIAELKRSAELWKRLQRYLYELLVLGFLSPYQVQARLAWFYSICLLATL
jgi:hypothetical protein